MPDPDSILPNIYIRSYEPLSVSFPAPGFYPERIRLILPDVEPSVLGRLSGSNSEPLCAVLTFQRPVNAKYLYGFLKTNLTTLQAISSAVATPVHRSLWRKLQVNGNRGDAGKKLVVPENPLEDLEEIQYPPDHKNFLKRVRGEDVS